MLVSGESRKEVIRSDFIALSGSLFWMLKSLQIPYPRMEKEYTELFGSYL